LSICRAVELLQGNRANVRNDMHLDHGPIALNFSGAPIGGDNVL
jgi:hypothetical protein